MSGKNYDRMNEVTATEKIVFVIGFIVISIVFLSGIFFLAKMIL